jgi:exopolysaccharide production protein ExoZ
MRMEPDRRRVLAALSLTSVKPVVPWARRGTLAGIQMMRGIAALLVVLRHSWLAAEQFSGQPFGAIQRQFIDMGAAGVDLFFVVSGFIMVHVAGDKFGLKGAGRDFLFRRIIRIAPLYWIISTAILVFWLAGLILRNLHLSATDVACSYLFAPCVHPHGPDLTTHPLLDQGWTLTYEWYFYLLFAFWLVVGSLRSLVIGAPLFFCAVIVLVSRSPYQGSAATFLADPLVFEFCFGLILGFIYSKGIRPTLPVGIGLIATGICLFIALSLSGWDVRWVIWGVPAAMIIFGALSIPTPTSFAGRSLVSLGNASYSLYLSHGVVTMTFSHFLSNRAPGVLQIRLWVCVLLVCLVCLAFGGVIHRLIERPLTEFLQAQYAERRGKRRQVPS